MKERIAWVDYSKAIGIFLVILAHTPLWTPAQNFIYAFHMPLFFFLSGLLFTFDRHPDFRNFVSHRFRQLMVPYFFFSIVTYLFWLFIGRKFGNDANIDIPLYQPILGIFYGVGTPDWMIHCIPLWFFPCLFLIELLYHLAFKHVKKRAIFVTGFLTIAFVFNILDDIRLPWSFNTVFAGLGIYGAGNISKDLISKLLSQKLFIQILLCIISYSLVYLVAENNGRINMHIHDYNNYYLFLGGAVAGITGTILTAHFLQQLFHRSYPVEYIAKNTFIIVGFHLMAGSLLKGITVFAMDLPLSVYQNAFLINVVFSLASLTLLIPVIFVLNAYFSFFIGGKSRVPVTNEKSIKKNIPGRA